MFTIPEINGRSDSQHLRVCKNLKTLSKRFKTGQCVFVKREVW